MSTFVVKSLLAFLMFAIAFVPALTFTGVYEDGSFKLLGTSYCLTDHICED